MAQSKIYEAISDEAFLNNLDYIPEEWKEKIKDTNWIYGDMFSDSSSGASQTGLELYKTEIGLKLTSWRAKSTEEAGGTRYQASSGDKQWYYKTKNGYWTDYITSKAGLMYVSDYYLSASDTANCQLNERKYQVCKDGWLHLSNNDSKPTNPHEWTISRYGWATGYDNFRARYVNSGGYSNNCSLVDRLSLRPSFYLTNDITITGDEGTIDHPFVLIF